MVKNNFFKIAILVAVVVIGFFLFRYFFPNDERQIIRRLNDLAVTSSFSTVASAPSSQIASGLFAQRVVAYFLTEAVLTINDADDYSRTYDGHEQLRTALFSARQQFQSLLIEIKDLRVTLNSQESAEAVGTIQARWQSVEASSTLSAQGIKFDLIKQNRQWVISRAETIQVIKK